MSLTVMRGPLIKVGDTDKINLHSQLLNKLLTLPVDKVFPALDLYRIFLTHPDSVCHFKKFEDGWTHLSAVLGVLSDS